MDRRVQRAQVFFFPIHLGHPLGLPQQDCVCSHCWLSGKTSPRRPVHHDSELPLEICDDACFRGGRIDRLSKVVALTIIAVERAQKCQLFPMFHALSNDVQT